MNDINADIESQDSESGKNQPKDGFNDSPEGIHTQLEASYKGEQIKQAEAFLVSEGFKLVGRER